MIGPLTAVRRLTSTATGLATSTVRTGVSVATTAAQGALHLVVPRSGGSSAEPEVPTPVRVPTEPDPAVKLAKAQARKAPAAKAPAKKAPAKKAPATKASTTTPKPATPKKKASEVPLKSDPTPASAAPPVPEGPDVLPGAEGATGLAEPEPLLDESVAKQVLSEAEVLRKAAE